MITLFRQVERYRVERYARVRVAGKRAHAWVVVGFFNAASSLEARSLGRAALADPVTILRAIPVGITR